MNSPLAEHPCVTNSPPASKFLGGDLQATLPYTYQVSGGSLDPSYPQPPEPASTPTWRKPCQARIESSSASASVAIIAGNSRVDLQPKSELLSVEPQIFAFRAGLALSQQYSQAGIQSVVSLAMDHKGVFRKSFLCEGLSNSAKRNPRLSQLHPEVARVFTQETGSHGPSAQSIRIMAEDSARTHALHVVNSGLCPSYLKRWMTVPSDSPPKSTPAGTCGALGKTCGNGSSSPSERVTCAAVTAEYYAKALKLANADTLEVCIQNDPWTKLSVFIRGAALLRAMGSQATIRLHCALPSGEVWTGKWY